MFYRRQNRFYIEHAFVRAVIDIVTFGKANTQNAKTTMCDSEMSPVYDPEHTAKTSLKGKEKPKI